MEVNESYAYVKLTNRTSVLFLLIFMCVLYAEFCAFQNHNNQLVVLFCQFTWSSCQIESNLFTLLVPTECWLTHLWTRRGKRVKKNDKLNKAGGHLDGECRVIHII